MRGYGELIVEINEAGYFVEDIDGTKEHCPAIGARFGASWRQLFSRYERQHPGCVRAWSLRPALSRLTAIRSCYASGRAAVSYITLEKVAEIALAQANVKAADAVFDDKEFGP